MMGYFANGTAGEVYEETYCMRCVHYSAEICPVFRLHMDWDSAQENDLVKRSALNSFIPFIHGRNQECKMFHAKESES